MHKTGHQGVNLIVASIATVLLYGTGNSQYILPVGIIIVALAGLPDIDMKLPIKHRGITHTIWFIALTGAGVGGATYALFASPELALAIGGATALGIFGHILGDVITPMGVQPFYPIGNTYSLGVVRAGNVLANWGLVIVGGAVLGTVVWLGITGQLPAF